jgi:hypothetical protein
VKALELIKRILSLLLIRDGTVILAEPAPVERFPPDT